MTYNAQNKEDSSYSLFQKIREYIRFKRKAGNRHDVHSPFVYDLVEKVLKKPIYHNDIESLRTSLKRDTRKLMIQDHGMGKDREVKVKKIASQSLKHKGEAGKLAALCQHYQVQKVIELGTSLGLTSAYMAKIPLVKKVISIEASEAILALAKENWRALGLDNIEGIQSPFDDIIDSLIHDEDETCLYFIDGNHSYEATLRYFHKIISYKHTTSIIVFDDIYWSDGMKKAWKHIVLSESSPLTVDLFEMGLVFLSPRMKKEHFILAY